MKVEITITGLDEARGLVSSFSDRRFNAVIASTLTGTAKAIRESERDAIAQSFASPLSYTNNSPRLKIATATNLQAEVYIADIKGGGGGGGFEGSPADYLQAEVQGGARRVKKFEKALQNQGSMPRGWVSVPGPAAKLDGYGNMSRSQIIQIIAQLGQDYSPGYARVIKRSVDARIAKARKSGQIYFAVTKAGQPLKPGVYLRDKRRGPRPVMYFVPQARYRVALRFADVAANTVADQLSKQWAIAYAKSAASLARKVAGS
jgi:alkylated DNA nucleotide flippase Atl1